MPSEGEEESAHYGRHSIEEIWNYYTLNSQHPSWSQPIGRAGVKTNPADGGRVSIGQGENHHTIHIKHQVLASRQAKRTLRQQLSEAEEAYSQAATVIIPPIKHQSKSQLDV